MTAKQYKKLHPEIKWDEPVTEYDMWAAVLAAFGEPGEKNPCKKPKQKKLITNKK